MPTSEWNAATSSGIAVIGTRRAITAPAPPPSAMPTITSSQATIPAGGLAASVVTMAIAMPTMPQRLPRWLDAGLDNPRSARMNRTPETRYRSATTLAFMLPAPASYRHARVCPEHPRRSRLGNHQRRGWPGQARP
jgi:hypothetical protein